VRVPVVPSGRLIITICLMVLIIIPLQKIRAQELDWKLTTLTDKLSDEKTIVADNQQVVDKSSNLEIYFQCSSDKVWLEIVYSSTNDDSCDKIAFKQLTGFSNKLGVPPAFRYQYRIDDEEIQSGYSKEEYCNIIDIPLSLLPIKSVPWTDITPTVTIHDIFTAKRLRVAIETLRGEKPVIDIHLDDPTLIEFAHLCPLVRERVSK
jgi:hypothetical protein